LFFYFSQLKIGFFLEMVYMPLYLEYHILIFLWLLDCLLSLYLLLQFPLFLPWFLFDILLIFPYTQYIVLLTFLIYLSGPHTYFFVDTLQIVVWILMISNDLCFQFQILFFA